MVSVILCLFLVGIQPYKIEMPLSVRVLFAFISVFLATLPRTLRVVDIPCHLFM